MPVTNPTLHKQRTGIVRLIQIQALLVVRLLAFRLV